jgi:hypothetical protein
MVAEHLATLDAALKVVRRTGVRRRFGISAAICAAERFGNIGNGKSPLPLAG